MNQVDLNHGYFLVQLVSHVYIAVGGVLKWLELKRNPRCYKDYSELQHDLSCSGTGVLQDIVIVGKIKPEENMTSSDESVSSKGPAGFIANMGNIILNRNAILYEEWVRRKENASTNSPHIPLSSTPDRYKGPAGFMGNKQNLDAKWNQSYVNASTNFSHFPISSTSKGPPEFTANLGIKQNLDAIEFERYVNAAHTNSLRPYSSNQLPLYFYDLDSPIPYSALISRS